jgi:hypothetical protein
MKAIERLLEYLNYKGIAPTRFEKDTGMSNGYIRTMAKRNADLGETIVNNILNNSPDLNPLWLILGEGSMLKSNKDPQGKPTTTSELPPGPCRECALRDKLIARQEQTIELLTDKINDLQLQLANNDTNHGNGHSYKQTG